MEELLPRGRSLDEEVQVPARVMLHRDLDDRTRLDLLWEDYSKRYKQVRPDICHP